MSATGRNAPCPCGSGKKYKRCCGAAGKQPEGYGEADAEAAIRELMRFSCREEFLKDRAVADPLFWGPRADELGEGVKEEIFSEMMVLTNFHCFFWYDCDLREGKTLVELFLRRRGRSVSSRVRRFLEDITRSHLGIYEILEARPGEGLRLRDLWAGEGEVWVQERAASRTLTKENLLGARLLKRPSGETVLVGDLYPFQAANKGKILSRLEKEYGARGELSLSRTQFLKRMGFLFHHLFLELGPLAPAPKMQTFDGESLEPTTMRFRISSSPRLVRALDACDDLQGEGQDSWVLLREVNGVHHWIAELKIQRTRLAVRSLAIAHARETRDLLERVAGDAVRYLKTERQDPREFMAKGKGKKGRALSSVSDVDRSEILREAMRGHYQRWMDERIPALGGATPREAAKDPDLRPRLFELLESLDADQKHRSAGVPRFDFGWLWTGLGIERPHPKPSKPYPFQSICLTHYLDGEDLSDRVPKTAQRIGLFYGRIAAFASRFGTDEVTQSGIACRRRPRNQPCGGVLLTEHDPHREGRLLWTCPNCEDAGSITDWRGTPFDQSQRPKGESLGIDLKDQSTLESIAHLTADALRVLLSARPHGEGVMLEGSPKEYSALASCALLELAGASEPSARADRLSELYVFLSHAAGEQPDLSPAALGAAVLLHREARRRLLRPVRQEALEAQTLCLHVRLIDIEPPIWRRIEVPCGLSLADLYPVLILSMGWSDSHLHLFQHEGRTAMLPEHAGEIEADDERAVFLSDVFRRQGDLLLFEYDLGDCWRHEIGLESVAFERCERPRLLAGERAAPPEDCGGPPGFEKLLAILKNPHHPEHATMREWAGPRYAAEVFEVDLHDRRLARLAQVQLERTSRHDVPKLGQ